MKFLGTHIILMLFAVVFTSGPVHSQFLDISPPQGVRVYESDRSTRWYAYFFENPELHVRVIAHVVDSSKLNFGEICGEGYALAMTGGFFENNDTGLSPVGLAVSASLTLVPEEEWQDGGFVWADKDGRVDFLKRRHGTLQGMVSEALQSRPFIIEDGKFDPATETGVRWDRIGIGRAYRDGREGVLVVAAISDLSRRRAQRMYEFAEAVKIIGENSSISIKDFLNLDGAAGPFVSVGSTGLYAGGRGRRYIPTVLCLA